MSREALALLQFVALPRGPLTAHLAGALAADLIGEGVRDEAAEIASHQRGWTDAMRRDAPASSGFSYRLGYADARRVRQ